MIPVFVEAGYRVIAPDLVGFGKSSKPINKTDYTYQNHVNWMGEILTQLDLKNVTLYCQDWGGMIGLRLVALFGNRFARLCASNTNLTTGYENPKDTEVAMKTFLKWKEFSQKLPFLPIGPILQRSTLRTLDDDEIMAYCMPYPDVEYMAGAMHFPFLVPLDYDHPESAVNRELWDNHLMKWEKPILTLFSDKDRLFFGQEKYIQMLPGAKGQPHTTIEDASHFLQEDKGEEIAHKVIEWMKTT
jgi:haloalkane dehalogenase